MRTDLQTFGVKYHRSGERLKSFNTMETIDAGRSRTLDEVRETLELAIIKESDLTNVTQLLYSVSECIGNKHTKLLELDEQLLATITKGDSLMFQGNEQDSVVLCTKNRTYDVKEAGTSNSCLLVPNMKLFGQTSTDTDDRVIKARNVLGVFHMYYEVKECTPKLEKLLTVLEPTSFKGKEYESTIAREHLYDWRRLQSEIQASEEELSRALKDYSIVNIDGYFRLVSFESEIQSLTLMLDLFDENCWELDEVSKEDTLESIKELLPTPVFDILFAKYTEVSGKSKENGTPLYRYNEEKCCKSLAKVLLVASPVTERKQFMESWNIGTPEKMIPKEEYLRGIALVTRNSSTLKTEVVSFPEADLSKNIDERFNELFKAKDKWAVQEITPYVSNLATKNMNVNALLTKHARSSVFNGIKYYSSKHGK